MIGFIKGKVFLTKKDYILIDCNGVGYKIFFYKTEKIKIGEELLVYTHTNVREDDISLFGFLSEDEYELFLKLISVKGLGSKTAMNILAYSSVQEIIGAISESNVNFFKSISGIGSKSASQIILDLKGKLVDVEKIDVQQNFKDVVGALKNFGYKSKEILEVLNSLSSLNLSEDEMIKKSLILLNKKGK